MSHSSWLKGTRPKDRREAGKSPSVFGHIDGVPVFTEFENRSDLSSACVHGPLRAGIAGPSKLGAYSVVMSGGYEDDVDEGESFFFTGSGGRDTKPTLIDKLIGKGNKWEGVQTEDQEFTRQNEALRVSSVHGKPVRVIRGSQLDSKYAPTEGYRYDGLYRVTKAWMDENQKGLKICRFAFERLPNQGEIPLNTNPRSTKPKSVELAPPSPHAPQTANATSVKPVASSSKATLDGHSASRVSNMPQGEKRRHSPLAHDGRPSKMARIGASQSDSARAIHPPQNRVVVKDKGQEKEFGAIKPELAEANLWVGAQLGRNSQSTEKRIRPDGRPLVRPLAADPQLKRWEKDPTLLIKPFGEL